MSETYLDESGEEPDVNENDDADDEQLEAEGGEEEGEQLGGDQDTEDRARAMGWNPDGELDAEAFIERQDSNLKAVGRKVDRLEATNADLEGRLETQAQEFERRFEKLQAMGKKALDKQRETLEAEYDRRARDAVENADPDAYDAVQAEKKERLAGLEDDESEEPDTKQVDRVPAHIVRDVNEWRENNKWFDRDNTMKAWASARHAELLQEKPGLSVKDNLAEVTAEARELWPAKFGKTSGTGGTRVEGGRRGSTPSGKRTLSGKLPKEAKQQAEAFVKDGTFDSVEEYAKSYFEEFPEDLQA